MSNQYHIHRHYGVPKPVNTSFSEGVELGNVLMYSLAVVYSSADRAHASDTSSVSRLF
jgi:hypothetical protein